LRQRTKTTVRRLVLDFGGRCLKWSATRWGVCVTSSTPFRRSPAVHSDPGVL